MIGVPGAGGPVWVSESAGVLGLEPSAQRIGEEVVVAVPLSLVIEWGQEQVVALQLLEQLLAVAAAGESVAQAAGELLQDRGVEKKRAHCLGLVRQHLFEQVV